MASEGEDDESSEPEDGKVDAGGSRKSDSSAARNEDSKQSDSTDTLDKSSAEAADAKKGLDESRRPTAAPGAKSESEQRSVLTGDGRWLIPGESDRPRGNGTAGVEAAGRVELPSGKKDDGGKAGGERLSRRAPGDWPDTAAEEEEEDTLDDIRQLGGAVNRVHVDRHESRRAAPDITSGGGGQPSETSRTEPESVQGARNKGLKTAQGGNTPGVQAKMRHINSSKSERSDLKTARLAKIRSRLRSQRQGGVH